MQITYGMRLEQKNYSVLAMRIKMNIESMKMLRKMFVYYKELQKSSPTEWNCRSKCKNQFGTI